MTFDNIDDWWDFLDQETVQSTSITDQDRWHTYYEKVVKTKDGKFYSLWWREGSTECQDCPFDEMYCEAIEVEPYQETVTKYKVKGN